MRRRHFLAHAGALFGTAALGQLGAFAARSGTAQAATATDYKALVCIFLYGGNDSNNMLVPVDAAGYANYARLRSTIALSQASLLPLAAGSAAPQLGFHPALPGLQSLWNAGSLAVVANVGTLVQPLTQAQYSSPSAAKPESLFSHIDQQHQWQAALSSTSGSSTGWGGRLADRFAVANVNATVPAMISTGGNNLFVTGAASQALVVPTSGSFGLNGFTNNSADTARRAAFANLLHLANPADLVGAAQSVMQNALASSAALNPVLATTDATLAARFGAAPDAFARQLLAIAKIIEARATLGARRQVFLATLGSFDTHTNELNAQQALYSQLDAGLTAFHGALADIGAGSSVTTFTLSDFSRTFQPNTGGGTDHGWGAHHLVLGDAVRGGQLYGTFPTLALGGPDDAGSEGRWIPTTSVDQYAATLAAWFGADAADLAAVLPNLGAFLPATLSFV
jgi:uncharacterized protein (DUF1501 family)